MHRRSLVAWQAISAALMLIVLILGIQLRRTDDTRLTPEWHTSKPDEWEVRRARTLWHQAGHEPYATIFRRQPNVVRFPNKTCVALTFSDYSVGANPVYCFDAKSRAVIYSNESEE